MVQGPNTIHQMNVNIKFIIFEASIQQHYGLKSETT